MRRMLKSIFQHFFSFLHSKNALLFIGFYAGILMQGCSWQNHFTDPDSLPHYTIGGTVTNLPSSSAMILQNNGADNLLIISNGTFQFSQTSIRSSQYKVTILRQPDDAVCTVINDTGVVFKNVTNISVICEGTVPYTIGGSVSGLSSGSFFLQNNGTNDLLISSNGSFTFTNSVFLGDSYNITVLTQPSGLFCTVTNGSGIVTSNITNIIVTCAVPVTYTIGGTIFGLTGTVVLQNNGGDNLTVTTNGSFTFSTALSTGNPYSVTVFSQPLNQICTVTPGTGSGTIANTNITSVVITCATAGPYTIGGTISGLTGTVVLQNNGGDNLTVTTNGSFTFSTALSTGNSYSVTVLTQPLNQICTVTPGTGSGTIANTNITSVVITCSGIGPFTVGGTISGLTGTVVLQNNGGDNLTRAINGNFTFVTSIAGGNPYSVTVLTQPIGQTCIVTANGSGTVTANITNIIITCGEFAFAGLQNGTVKVSSDAGITWSTTTNSPDGSAVNSLFATSNGILYAGTANGNIEISQDGGNTWSATSAKPDGSAVNGVFVVTSGNIYAGTANGNIEISTNGGSSWTPTNQPDGSGVNGIFVNSSGNIWASTTNGNIEYSISGISWSALNGSPDSSAVTNIFVTSSQLYVITANENIFTSTSLTGGGSWTWNAQTASSLFVNSTGSKIYAGSQSGFIFSLDLGTELAFLTYSPVKSIFFLN